MLNYVKGLCSLLLIVCPVIVWGQINLVSSDMPSPVDTLLTATDTTVGWFTLSAAGPNQTWDFSQAEQHTTTATFVVNPSSTPFSGTFSSSTSALTQDNASYLFYQNTTGAYIATGVAGDLLDTGNNIDVAFSPTSTTYQFPTQYGNSFSGNSGISKTVSGSSVGQPVDEVRLTVTSDYTDTIDSWGTVITPIGSYDALRRKRIETSYTLIEFRLIPIGPWSTAAEIYDTATVYEWLAKESLGPLVTLGLDTLDNVISLSYSLTPPAPTANFSYNNVSGGVVDFTDLSTNSPSTWSWDFGNAAATSSMQNPNYNYPSNGAYYTCLTVTNVSGNDVFCDSVHVTNVLPNNAPIARDDTASVTAPSMVSIPVLNNDQEPDGDPFSITTAVNGTGGTTVVSGGNVNYTASSLFAGVDSFYYIICDNGIPALCDTAMVFVNVTANPTTVSFAVDSTDCLNRVLVNTSQNTTGLAAWRYVKVGTTDTVSFLGDTLLLQLQGTASTEDYYVCISGFDAANQVITACNTVQFLVEDSCLTSIAAYDLGRFFTVYPNPVSNNIVIENSSNLKQLNIAVYNQYGQLVLNESINETTSSHSLEMLSAGVYFLRILGDDNTVITTQKLIKLQ